MKTWLKGGLIGLGIAISGIILGSFLWIPFENNFLFLSGFSVPLVLALWVACGPVDICPDVFFTSPNVFSAILFFIFSALSIAIVYFFIGSLIGWIVGRIKNK